MNSFGGKYFGLKDELGDDATEVVKPLPCKEDVLHNEKLEGTHKPKESSQKAPNILPNEENEVTTDNDAKDEVETNKRLKETGLLSSRSTTGIEKISPDCSRSLSSPQSMLPNRLVEDIPIRNSFDVLIDQLHLEVGKDPLDYSFDVGRDGGCHSDTDILDIAANIRRNKKMILFSSISMADLLFEGPNISGNACTCLEDPRLIEITTQDRPLEEACSGYGRGI
ncbi:Hypothetical predicted protein [Olea europaea subsp. europaea]|uniref:Uncharacterized protein n=1 Tax=Olea europaea subsp. europaea TaxID=158383 RepID=A0A8S0T618_OLEEU|nr:Hypothetical predicted protein [Olea europaea subsp. europaea]